MYSVCGVGRPEVCIEVNSVIKLTKNSLHVCCVQMCDEEPVTPQADFRNDVTIVGKSIYGISDVSIALFMLC